MDVLRPRSGRELAGLPPDASLAEGSAEEREAAHRIAEAYNVLTHPRVVAQFQDDEAHAAGDRRRWSAMTHWFEPRDG